MNVYFVIKYRRQPLLHNDSITVMDCKRIDFWDFSIFHNISAGRDHPPHIIVRIEINGTENDQNTEKCDDIKIQDFCDIYLLLHFCSYFSLLVLVSYCCLSYPICK